MSPPAQKALGEALRTRTERTAGSADHRVRASVMRRTMVRSSAFSDAGRDRVITPVPFRVTRVSTGSPVPARSWLRILLPASCRPPRPPIQTPAAPRAPFEVPGGIDTLGSSRDWRAGMGSTIGERLFVTTQCRAPGPSRCRRPEDRHGRAVQHGVDRLPQRAGSDPRGRTAGGRRDRRRADRPARDAQADCQRELRLPRGAAGDGQLAQRQVRRGHRRPPLLRRLPQRRHRRGAGRGARPQRLRRRPRLCAAAFGHRREPRRLLGGALPAGGDAGAGPGGCAAGQRPDRAGLGAAAGGVRQPADAGHVARRGRPPHPRLPAEHLRQDVRPAQLRHRPADRAAGLRGAAGDGPRVPPADHRGGLLRLPPAGELPHHAGDRRRGRRDLDGRHGPLRGPGRGQGADRRLRPGAAREHRHDHHPQVAARPARRHGAVRRRAGRARRPGLSDGAGRSAAARDGGQGGGARGGGEAGVRQLRAGRGGQRAGARRGPAHPGREAGHRRHRQPPGAHRRVGLRPDRAAGRGRAAGLGHRHQPQLGAAGPERRLVHLGHQDRHPGADHPRPRRGGDGRDRRPDRHRAVRYDSRGGAQGRAVEGAPRAGRGGRRPGRQAGVRPAGGLPALLGHRPELTAGHT
ncbi:hypothetical protein SBRY_70365 [Actinacidiphila bryophytorum]|uniref:Uncharacterized protein n=1 Tax=Actinacidiphila bryophytorum TaxID=1436133 RepID=A0A9W4MHE5_9ACTN|nr:hypothetical protein SBRY_70365 [Actinacidiphila bryophytorum]